MVSTYTVHRCKSCGTLWRKHSNGSWSLNDASQTAGQCCDNNPNFLNMIEPVETDMTDETKLFPIQARARSHPSKGAVVPEAVYMAAYEVYCHVFAPQEAMIIGSCRGGFGTGELIAFLYARSFPRAEWGKRMDEAFKGMDIA